MSTDPLEEMSKQQAIYFSNRQGEKVFVNPETERDKCDSTTFSDYRGRHSKICDKSRGTGTRILDLGLYEQKYYGGRVPNKHVLSKKGTMLDVYIDDYSNNPEQELLKKEEWFEFTLITKNIEI